MNNKTRLNAVGQVYCPSCDNHKDKSSFCKTKRNKIGLNWQCRDCAAERSLDAHYKTRYGITNQDKLNLIEEQNNKCDCCKKEFNDTPRGKPVVDHCHTTGAVRKILCDRCNVALGIVNEDVELCLNLVEYIKRNC